MKSLTDSELLQEIKKQTGISSIPNLIGIIKETSGMESINDLVEMVKDDVSNMTGVSYLLEIIKSLKK